MKKNAFTLVELLVVIAIIGMLAALITAAGNAAINAAKQARIKMVMGQVELALEQYKNKYGEYPPDWSDQTAVVRHIKKRWPRIDLTFGGAFANANDPYDNFRLYIERATGWDTANMTYLGSLPFWLGGLPDNIEKDGNDYTWKTPSTPSDVSNFTTLAGFSTDPERPLDAAKWDSTNSESVRNSSLLETPLMELTKGKNLAVISISDGSNSGIVPAIFAEKGPIVYFKAYTGGRDADAYKVPPYVPGNTAVKNLWSNTPSALAYDIVVPVGNGVDFYPGVAVPYLMSSGKWYNPKSYQLVHPGIDGKFGRWGDGGANGVSTVPGGVKTDTTDNTDNTPVLTTGNGITQFDMDNVVNFSDGATIQSILP
ncbi:MAG: type II secretion system GspH family protein [Planctomycetaceae bacterium]|nr:type II secretion system GspH family protein [Planctomycetaceae bacterium]